jgi:hypothetical protein
MDTDEEFVKGLNDLEKVIEKQSIVSFDPTCIRQKSNWSKRSKVYRFDELDFKPEKLLNDIPENSPKLNVLLKKINQLDKDDMKKHGKLFKHFIFSDLKSSAYGAKLIASALIAKGMKLGYNAKLKKGIKKNSEVEEDDEEDDDGTPLELVSLRKLNKGGKDPKKNVKKYEKIELLSNSVLENTKNNNFYLLSSVSVYDQPINVPLKKEILKSFNSRPDNIHGELARIIVMDSGFKEGIDLFDIKYVHIFEPSVVNADEKQVIGRGTRTCGQRGLDFHPQQGWPLHVFVYDLKIPDKLQNSFMGSKTTIEIYLKAMNLDIRLLKFAHDLEKTTVVGSVDYDLNKNIHSFSIPIVSLDADELDEHLPGSKEAVYDGGAKKLVIREGDPILIPEPKRLGFEDTRKYIKDHFSEFKWDAVKMENLCADKQGGGAGQIINYTPTQDFIRHYFTPTNPVKGMLLHHSVGTGKTCSAIAAATSNFEKQGYTILWVTRTTLKSDIWKNMFDQVCSESIRHQLVNSGLQIPNDQNKRMRLLSNSWKIRPMSYKQFSNLVSKKNSMYDTLVKINGREDPLRRTLLIIDEAHKLYGGGDLSNIEKPDMNLLHQSLMYSYQYSGFNSVKLLLMTATPITNDPMELIKLINLCKSPDEQMPADFDAFANKYLNDDGEFTDKGRSEYLDDIAGYVSYLNREKDARQFSQPIIEHIEVPIVSDIAKVEQFDKKVVRDLMESDIPDLKRQILEQQKELKGELSDLDVNKFNFLKDEVCGDLDGREFKDCNKIVKRNIRELVNEAKAEVKKIREKIKEVRGLIKERNKSKQDALKDVKINVDQYKDEYEKYKNSVMYQLKNKCAKKITRASKLAEVVGQHPAIINFDERIKSYNDRISELESEIKNLTGNYKKRMEHLKLILKKDLSELERGVIKSTIVDDKKDYNKLLKLKKKDLTVSKRDINKNIRSIQQTRKKYIVKVQKVMKKKIKEDTKSQKKIDREEKKLRKTLRKQGEYEEEIKHDVLVNLVDKYRNKMLENMVDYDEEIVAKEKDKEEKKQIKQVEKQKVAAAKKEEKEKLRQTKKAEKEKAQSDKKAAAEKLRQTKKADKERAIAEKKAEKEREKQTKKEKAAMEKKTQRKTKKNEK